MLYTVKEVSELSGVTIKTLHHYHKIGLLLPAEISEAGYRLYGSNELKRLQHILFYRELDFQLEQIKMLMEETPERSKMLLKQEKLLMDRVDRLGTILQTLRQSLTSTEEGISMEPKEMFRGFDSEEEWKEALTEHNHHLKEQYDVDMLENESVDVPSMNEQALEAAAFMAGMANALKTGIRHDDERIRDTIREHLQFMNEQGHTFTAADFAGQTKFFLNDDFHLRMLEEQQTGLAYYLQAAAEAYTNLA
ncbi:MerR family transcriptional regulator [Paenibacillus solani]|uniref:MerR family transcriptional regulator n=1 Tax=Paenibacillus solani TaxID=1705565 RepID=A0A0M1P0Y7_9BACL|nr:MerR family transcriptional regulator [Paenibacillus solani]KOR87915.1 MerR family transcriptional regulator [Paenibacillus solani]